MDDRRINVAKRLTSIMLISVARIKVDDRRQINNRLIFSVRSKTQKTAKVDERRRKTQKDAERRNIY